MRPSMKRATSNLLCQCHTSFPSSSPFSSSLSHTNYSRRSFHLHHLPPSTSPWNTHSSPSPLFASFFSTAPPSSKKKDNPAQTQTKKMLRDLYRKVHPDLFEKYPEEQKINATSFKNLQKFIQDCDAKGLVPSRRYPITFYFHPEKKDTEEVVEEKPSVEEKKNEGEKVEETQTEAQQSNKEEEEQKKDEQEMKSRLFSFFSFSSTTTTPPPSTSSNTSTSSSNPPTPPPPSLPPLLSVSHELHLPSLPQKQHTKHTSLLKLFSACHTNIPQLQQEWEKELKQLSSLLSSPSSSSSYSSSSSSSSSSSQSKYEGEEGMEEGDKTEHGVYLNQFLRQFADPMLDRTESIGAAERQVALLRSILVRQRRVHALFDPNISTEDEVKALSAILKPLDGAKFVRDTTLFFTHNPPSARGGVDSMGRVHVPLGRESVWEAMMLSIDEKKYEGRKRFADQIKLHETEIMQLIGGKGLWAAPRLPPFENYSNFLSHWLASLTVDGCWGKLLNNRKAIDHFEFFVTPNKKREGGGKGKWKMEEVVTKDWGGGAEDCLPFKVNLGTGACYLPLLVEEVEGGGIGEERWEELASFLDFVVDNLGEEMERRKMQGSEIDTLIAYTRRSMLLRTLRKHPDVSFHQMKRFCFHIRSRKITPSRLCVNPLQDMRVLVTNRFHADFDRGVMEIPWDFEF